MKVLTCFIFAFSIQCFFLVFSQDEFENTDYLTWYKQAEILYNGDNPTDETDKKAVEFYSKTIDILRYNHINARVHTDCLKKIADIYLGEGLYKTSIAYYTSAIEVNFNSGLNDSLYDYQSKLYLGSAYYQLNVIDSARYFFEQASSYTHHRLDLPDISFLYNSLGVIYFESANFLQAKNYFEQAIPDGDSLRQKDPHTYVSLYTNIATCLKFLGKTKDALSLYQTLLPLKIATDKIIYNIANSYFLLQQYDSALMHYNNVTTDDNSIVIKKMNDVGRILTATGKWQQAEFFFDSAILLNKRYMGIAKNKDLAYSYLYKAELAQKQGLTDEAIIWCNSALQVLHFSFICKNITDLPDDETKVISPLVFFEALRKKGELLYLKYQKDKNELLQKSSLAAYMKAIKIASFIKASFDDDDARIFFKDNYKNIYSEAIDVAYALSEKNDKQALDNFLQIMESYKGSVLYQNQLQVALKNSKAIPPNVIAKERELKQLLAAYTTRLNNNNVAEDVSSLQKRIIELEVEISRLQKLYEQYPEFEKYKRQSDANSITVDAIRKQLDAKTAVISFLHTGEYIYGLTITNNDFIIRKIKSDSALEQSIQIFLSSLYEHTNGKRYKGYTASAYIYRQLIHPFSDAVAHKDRWVILPDGILNYMPFNALQEDENKRDYLAESKIISNHYSLLLLLAKSKVKKEGLEKPLIFAPFIFDSGNHLSSDLPILFNSSEEVAAFEGESYTGIHATKSKFINSAEKASIIHLATHARADVDSFNNACIYFYPSDTNHLSTRLYAPEVYNLELHNTKLVILSACETASGKNSSGEGLMSIARGFLYAGSDGVISTFWKTDDKVSAYIMQQLHHYLRQKKSPEEALYLAKKDFLSSNKFDLHYKTPNYWANFIFIGTLTQIKQESHTNTFPIIILIIMSIAIFILLLNRRKPLLV